ncbi:class I SAM-dependent methyltransferase [Bacillus piscicola]|uniref:class I SAM-dependent methyltransferase n=1 Tax=Bacillus piscicola TaxID=1632684 RepID=UPI001F09D389|nr:methyltransferase [Bacillus piscicola]
MGSHYFDQHPEIDSHERIVQSKLRGNMLSFTTDHGVFSKNEVDFGTRLLVNTFEWPEESGSILDMGCGYGPIGITLAKETERMVWLADVNQRALALAQKNADFHRTKNVTVTESSLFAAISKQDFAAVLTNPPIRAGKSVVHRLFEEVYDHLKQGGELWVVIQKKQGAPSALAKLELLFQEVSTVAREKGYYIFRAKKV